MTDYTIEKIVERLSEPDKLIDPSEVNILQSYLNGHIVDLEEEAWKRQLLASDKLVDLNKELSAAKADAIWKGSNEWRLWQGLERTIKQLKRYRSDLRDRFSILTNTKRY